MNRKLLLAGFALGAIVLGVMAGMILARSTAKSGAPSGLASAPARSAIPPAVLGQPPMMLTPPPSMVGQGSAGSPALPQNERMLALQSIRARLNAMTTSGKPIDPKALDGVLADLSRTQGNNVGGVDISALRENLERAQQIQALAGQIQAESRQPKPDTQRIQGLLAQIQKLQSGMQTNVIAQPPAAAH